jgi:dephospho-CoA kinase
MSLRVGVTGGIGSGKSLVCNILTGMGFPVYNSDTASKVISDSNEGVKRCLKQLFGEDIYCDSKLNRERVASLVFRDNELLQQLNSIIHPAVMADFERWVEANNANPLIFMESAILFETGIYKMLDKTVLVVAPADVRIRRVMARDKVNEKTVQARMSNQMDDELKAKLADFIINNDGKSLLLPQIIGIVERLIHSKVNG